ncbi:MAG: ABC transporter substrate-binding protein [Candidatus Neomarinimicrobiota bacterium]
MKKYVPLILVLFIFSCGGNEKNKSKQSFDKKSIVPKDTQTPAKDGGYGFEEIYKDLGYDTYILPEEDYKYFGSTEAVKGGHLKHIRGRFPATMRVLGQHYNYAENIDIIIPLCYQTLLGTHPVTLDYMPGLATHWKVSEDKMQMWFRINPDARFSDGAEVTAEDVVASWDIRMDETILMPSTQLVYGKLEKPEILGKYIVTVKAKTLNWRNLLYFSGMSILPEHYLKDLDGTAYLEEYNMKMLPGSGPYIIKDEDIINQESFSLTKLDNWWAKGEKTSKNLYNFDRITISVVKDNEALMYEKFKKGESDFYQVTKPSRWIDETDFESVQKGWIQKRRVHSSAPAGTWGYAFNMRKWPFDDKRVRYAFSYLYDREKLNKEILYNEYTIINSLYSGSVYENPENEKFTFNPRRAVELLEDAGYKNRNSNGILIHEESGRPLSFNIDIRKPSEYRVTPMQQILKQYGIDMQIKFIDATTRWKNLMDRNFTIDFQAWGGLVFPNPETSIKSTLADKKNNNNITGFKNDRVDELLDLYDVEFDQNRRIEIIREIDGIYSDIHPAAWGMSRLVPERLLYWNKFGYPDYMLTKYSGSYSDILIHWWFDDANSADLAKAIETNSNLQVGDIEHTYWKDLR